MCQSHANHVPIMCQSCANHTPIARQSRANHVPIARQSRANRTPIARQSHANHVAGEVSRWGKLCILGSGEAGKTSMLRAMQRGRPDPTDTPERTVQLSLTVLAVGDGSETPVMLSCWDVGGQPDYEALQQPYAAIA